ncbi:hypothetical protein RP20_CCG015776 [Aedes albopictus]|nr:hypothetical protein RP20_CCG015776 [Aedes albopictus]
MQSSKRTNESTKEDFSSIRSYTAATNKSLISMEPSECSRRTKHIFICRSHTKLGNKTFTRLPFSLTKKNAIHDSAAAMPLLHTFHHVLIGDHMHVHFGNPEVCARFADDGHLIFPTARLGRGYRIWIIKHFLPFGSHLYDDA